MNDVVLMHALKLRLEAAGDHGGAVTYLETWGEASPWHEPCYTARAGIAATFEGDPQPVVPMALHLRDERERSSGDLTGFGDLFRPADDG